MHDHFKAGTLTATEYLGQLRAKEDLHRQEAKLILKNLAHQCSDPGALEELINFLFAVLNGIKQCAKISLVVMLLRCIKELFLCIECTVGIVWGLISAKALWQ